MAAGDSRARSQIPPKARTVAARPVGKRPPLRGATQTVAAIAAAHPASPSPSPPVRAEPKPQPDPRDAQAMLALLGDAPAMEKRPYVIKAAFDSNAPARWSIAAKIVEQLDPAELTALQLAWEFNFQAWIEDDLRARSAAGAKTDVQRVLNRLAGNRLAYAAVTTDPDRAATLRALALSDLYASNDAGQYRRGAEILCAMSDSDLLAMQKAWNGMHRDTLYFQLFQSWRIHPRPELKVALERLETSFLQSASALKTRRNTGDWRRLLAEYSQYEIVDALAQSLPRLLMSDDPEAIDALRRRSPEVLAAIDERFLQHNDVRILPWLIRSARRSRNMVNAVGYMRGSEEHLPHMLLAAVLVPPDNANKTIPLEKLRGKVEGRREIITAFNRTFAGIGPEPGQTRPDTLGEYLNLRLKPTGPGPVKWLQDWAPLYEALFLLKGEVTDAQTLFIKTSHWLETYNDDVFSHFRDMAKRGVGRAALEDDWRRNVRYATPALTSLDLEAHLKWVFGWRGTEGKGHVLALLQAMPQSSADPAPPATPAGSADEQYDRDTRSHHRAWDLEDRRITASQATITATQGHISPNDAAILDAIRTILAVHDERIGRIAALITATGQPGEDRTRLKAFMQNELKRAAAVKAKARRDLAIRVRANWTLRGPITLSLAGDLSPIRISGGQKRMAMYLLTEGGSKADELLALLQTSDWAAVLTLVGKVWAEGGIDQLLADAKRTAGDGLGHDVRAAYQIDLWLDSSQDPSAIRARKLLTPGVSNGQRGLDRILWEIARAERWVGASGSELTSIVDLFKPPSLKAEVRDATLAAYRDHRAKTSPAVAAQSPADVFLADMRRIYQGDSNAVFALEKLIKPPVSAGEQIDYVRRRAAAQGHSRKARLHEAVWGGGALAARDAEAAAVEWSAWASPERLDPALRQLGATERTDATKAYAAAFDARSGDVTAMETACAEAVSSVISLAVAAGVTLLPGGFLLASTLGALASSVAGMLAQEAMLGNEYKLMSRENLAKALTDMTSGAISELGVTARVAARIPLRSLTLTHPTLGGALQSGLSSLPSSLINSSISAGVNRLILDKTPTAADIATGALNLINTTPGKLPSTWATTYLSPTGTAHAIALATRLRNRVAFEAASKLPSILIAEGQNLSSGGVPNQTIGQRVLQVLGTETKSDLNARLKTRLAETSRSLTERSQRDRLAGLQAKEPELFESIVTAALRTTMNKSTPLRTEYPLYKAAHPDATEAAFMLEKLARRSVFGSAEAEDLERAVLRDLSQLADAHMTTATPGGLWGFGTRDPGSLEQVLRAGLKRRAARSAQPAPTAAATPAPSPSPSPSPTPTAAPAEVATATATPVAPQPNAERLEPATWRQRARQWGAERRRRLADFKPGEALEQARARASVAWSGPTAPTRPGEIGSDAAMLVSLRALARSGLEGADLVAEMRNRHLPPAYLLAVHGHLQGLTERPGVVAGLRAARKGVHAEGETHRDLKLVEDLLRRAGQGWSDAAPGATEEDRAAMKLVLDAVPPVVSPSKAAASRLLGGAVHLGAATPAAYASNRDYSQALADLLDHVRGQKAAATPLSAADLYAALKSRNLRLQDIESTLSQLVLQAEGSTRVQLLRGSAVGRRMGPLDALPELLELAQGLRGLETSLPSDPKDLERKAFDKISNLLDANAPKVRTRIELNLAGSMASSPVSLTTPKTMVSELHYAQALSDLHDRFVAKGLRGKDAADALAEARIPVDSLGRAYYDILAKTGVAPGHPAAQRQLRRVHDLLRAIADHEDADAAAASEAVRQARAILDKAGQAGAYAALPTAKPRSEPAKDRMAAHQPALDLLDHPDRYSDQADQRRALLAAMRDLLVETYIQTDTKALEARFDGLRRLARDSLAQEPKRAAMAQKPQDGRGVLRRILGDKPFKFASDEAYFRLLASVATSADSAEGSVNILKANGVTIADVRLVAEDLQARIRKGDASPWLAAQLKICQDVIAKSKSGTIEPLRI